MKRGEIWWASLPEPSGSGPGLRRPVVVISANSFNVSRIATVIVAAITSNLRLAHAPGNVLLPPRTAGLPKQSVVNVSQVITIDKGRLTAQCGRIGAKALNEIDDGLRLALSL